MRILVTGVAGFMASHLSDALLKEGHTVYGIDNESIGLKENVPQGVIYEKADLRDPSKIKKLIERWKPELVYHTAAWAHEGLSQFMPRLITENNYNAFLNLIGPCINNGMKRIVVFSSMSVYGSQTPPFHEALPRSPEDVYAVAKTAMERTTEVLADVFDFEYVIIRPHNVYGPRQMLHDPYRNVIGIMMNRIMNKKAPIIYGDGEQTRAFSYIDDVTPYVLKAGFLPETNHEIINIGPLEEYTINELADTVLKAFHSHLKPIHFEDRPREVKHAFCTNYKAQRLLGYKTSITLKQGIGRMADWARSQGPQQFRYLDELELQGNKIPKTWKEKIL